MVTKSYSKYILILLITVVYLLLAACSQEEDAKPAETSTAPAAMEQPSSSSTDGDDTTMQATTPNPETMDADSSQATPPDTMKESTTEEKTPDTDEQLKPASEKEPTQQGHEAQLALAQKSGCLACHAVDKKLVGPPWRDVSKRYKDDPNAKAKLIAKVSKGGRGNWTEVVGPVAMPPYSPRVSDDNIAQLVDFVLSLEK